MILKRNNKFRVAIFLLAIFVLNILSIQPAQALNFGSGNKAYNFQGYRYIDTHNIEVWLDKSTPLGTQPANNAAQFKIYQGPDINGQALQIQGVAAGSGSNITGVTGLSGGAPLMITTATNDAFIPGGLYTVVLNSTIKANNGIVLGNYGNKDAAFSFTVPDVGATPYSVSAQGSLNLSPQNNATNVPLEGNIGFSVNIPVSNYAAVKSGMVLKKGGVVLNLDPSIDATSNGDIYAPIVTDDHTLFFFPMTGGGSAYSYNLAPSSSYELSIPDIQLITGNTITAQTITFTTTSEDTPTKISGAPTTSANAENLNISWSASIAVTNVSPAATGYNVYASSNPYWNFVKLNSSPITAPTTSYVTTGLTPSTSYYFRVTPMNGASEGGFSDYINATTPEDLILPTWPPGSTLSTSNVTETGLTLSWTSATDNVGVAGYQVYQNDVLINSVNKNTTNCNVTGLTQATPYTFKVRAVDLANLSTIDDLSAPITTQATPVKPATPVVTNDDTLNTVTGMAPGMEYNLDSVGYVVYNAIVFNALDFSGNHNLLVRVEAVGINPASDAITLTFTTNPVEQAGGGGGTSVIPPAGSAPQVSGTPLVSTPVQVNSVTTVQADDGSKVLIPFGALSNTGAPVEITISKDIQTVNPTTPGVISYDPQLTERSFGPSGTVFNVPVTISIPFGSANIDSADLSHLAVFLWQTDHWQKVGGIVDSVNKTVSVTVSHFSTYRIMADRTATEERIGGLDRYETAVKIAQNYFATGADTVILTRGDISADALTAVPLAKHFNAPLLLTPQDQLPEQVLNEIKTLGVKTVYIVGGEMAVSSQIADVITGQGIKIQRVAGIDRYSTAYKVAKLLGHSGQAVIVNGNDYAYPDALSISSWAAYNGVPILYTDGTTTLPEVTGKALTELKVSRTILVGGTAVLPKSLEGLVPNPERYAGVDRYGTNIQALSKLQPNPVQIFAATGNNFADALAGAVIAGQSNAWLILTGSSQTNGSGLTTEQKQLLQSVNSGVMELHVFGGTVAMPDTTLNELKKDLSI